MKRMWIGAGLLVLLLAAGILTGAAIESEFRPGADQLRRAEEAALAGDWDRAAELTGAVRADWDRTRGLVQILNSHDEVDRIQILFAQLDACERIDGISYGTLCAALAEELASLGRAHRLIWENLL